MSAYPDFFIVGAAKAGTTTLHQRLARHPELAMSRWKEPHHFADFTPDPRLQHMIRRYADASEYLSLFPDHGRLRGESSPSYLFDSGAAQRIRRRLPQARIIVLLRDPVARAHSHYLMDVREGLQAKPFLPALQADYALAGKSWGGRGHCYVELGCYASQLQRYFDVFPREQILLLDYAQLQAAPQTLLLQLAGFLQIDPAGFAEPESVEACNAYARPRHALGRLLMSQQGLRRQAQHLLPAGWRRRIRQQLLRSGDKPVLDVAARSWLQAVYEPELQALDALLGPCWPSLRGETSALKTPPSSPDRAAAAA